MYHASKVEEIYKEAQALKKLNHPNIVKLFHTLMWKNFVVLIMEYVAGGEMLQYVEHQGPDGLTEREAHAFFIQLTDAVNYCHNKFVIHRDLKPENVLLTDPETRQIKVPSSRHESADYRLRHRGGQRRQQGCDHLRLPPSSAP